MTTNDTVSFEYAGVKVTIPAIGAVWYEQGGHYAGVVRGDQGEPDYMLIVGDDDRSVPTWDEATLWAASDWRTNTMKAHADWSLPKPKEQAVMFGNVPELFKKAWYWSCEQAELDSASAQSFTTGAQYDGHKASIFRARAIRRVAIR